MELATLGGGCFWCLDAVYEQMAGVTSVESGYTGGHVTNPDYRSVCTGRTGHIEVVRVEFDPELTSYRNVLEVFFAIHDPTSRDRQGNDAGPQYRSAIFTHNDDQRATAQAIVAELKADGLEVVTEVLPAAVFYRAEEYHQHYFATNPGQGYCAMVIAPKVAKFRAKFVPRLKAAGG
jgi:peptide-methionine (S)-S-oxide reductase